MKTTKRLKKVRQTKAELELAKSEPMIVPAVVPHMTFRDNPPPEYLLEVAAKEPNRRLVEEYYDAIVMLKDEKQFTFREIATWLHQFGIQADHNAVYRAYTKGMSAEEAGEPHK